MVNDNQLSFKINKLERNMAKKQALYSNNVQSYQNDLDVFSEETNQMEAILEDLENRLKKCQDKIGIFV